MNAAESEHDPSAFAGAAWLRANLRLAGRFHPPPRSTSVSALGAEVAEILGLVWRGLYHLEHERILRTVDWSSEHFIEVRLASQTTLATFDGQQLSELVILAHDRAIRLEVSPDQVRRRRRLRFRVPGQEKTVSRRCTEKSPALCLRFHRRQREGGMSQRHPTLEDAAGRIRTLAARQPFPALPPAP